MSYVIKLYFNLQLCSILSNVLQYFGFFFEKIYKENIFFPLDGYWFCLNECNLKGIEVYFSQRFYTTEV